MYVIFVIIVCIFVNGWANVLPVKRSTRDLSNTNLQDAIHQFFKPQMPPDVRTRNLPKYLQSTESFEHTISPEDKAMSDFIIRKQAAPSENIRKQTHLSTPEELVNMETKEISWEELDKRIRQYFPEPNDPIIYNGRPVVLPSHIMHNYFNKMVVEENVYKIPQNVLDEIFSKPPPHHHGWTTESPTNKTGVNGTFNTDDRFQNSGAITAAFRNMLIPAPKRNGTEVAPSAIGARNSPQHGSEVVPPVIAAGSFSQDRAEAVPSINGVHHLIQEKNRSSIDHPPLCFILMFVMFLSIVF